MVVVEGNVGVIGHSHGKTSCVLGPTYPQCVHLKYFNNLLNNPVAIDGTVLSFMAKNSSTRSSYHRKCHSKDKIPFYLNEKMREKVKTPVTEFHASNICLQCSSGEMIEDIKVISICVFSRFACLSSIFNLYIWFIFSYLTKFLLCTNIIGYIWDVYFIYSLGWIFVHKIKRGGNRW